MFYEGSTLELATELVDPETMKDDIISDPSTDGIRLIVVFQNQIIKESYLGNKEHNSHLSYHYPIDHPAKQGIYLVCLAPSNTLFENEKKNMDAKGESTLYGKVF